MLRQFLGKARQRPPVLWVVLGILGLASLVYAGAGLWLLSGVMKWHMLFFSNANLVRGEPVRERWAASPDFDFGEGSPMAGIPKDNFSARADACLSLRVQRHVLFALASDDGSRMFLDGRQIIDNWGAHGLRYRHADLDLAPGCHALRIEYFEGGGSACLQFLMGLDGETPDRIDPGLLSRPLVERGSVRCRVAPGGLCE
jgi:hypothetical protein